MRLGSVVFAISCLAASATSQASDYRFIEIRYPGAADTIATGVTDAGLVVGTYGPSIDVRRGTENGRRGFVHNPINGSYTSLNAFGSAATNVSSVNNSGLVVGDYFVGNRLRGFVYDIASGIFTDVFPDVPGAEEAVIGDIDDNGVVIGTFANNTSLSAPDSDSLSVRGFRGTPDPTGGYAYEVFDFPFATSTFGGSRNTSGVEVGTAIEQSIFGDSVYAYSLSSSQQYEFVDPLTNSTQFSAVNNGHQILGTATVVSLDGSEVVARNESFLLQADASGQFDASSLQPLALPCPTCAFTIDFFTGVPDAVGRSVATNLNDTGSIVGFTDYGTPNLVGFLGVSTPADFNLDGVVDAADYTVWRDNLGSNAMLIADENQDGLVNQPDYDAWEAAYGSGSPTSSTLTVPEPTSIAVALVGLFLNTKPLRGRLRLAGK